MKVSLNWIRYYNSYYKSSAEPAPEGAERLVEKIGAQLGAVEEVVNLGECYKNILVVKVISAEKHPNADKLKICLIDDGGANKKAPRNRDGFVEVVCGAPNVKAGQLVAWIPPGATVPSSFDKEPFVIDAREIRGQMSNGMLDSAKELSISEDHGGLMIIDQPAKPGQLFSELFELDDHIIDIENKMFTHRPDLFGQLGIARELAGIQGHSYKSPAWYNENADISRDGRGPDLKLKIDNKVPKHTPRFCAVAIKGVKVGPSPIWMQSYLTRVGVRPINNLVDITNYYMLLTAQPLHAYDYDKVKSGILGTRLSKKGENLKLLGGKTIKLEDGAVVITDGIKPIGLGGIMGGADTEVDANTRNIILECANFDMNQTRKTAMAYGLFTDAATRFTKNQSSRQNRAVIAKAADDILKIAGGRIASPLLDDNSSSNKDYIVRTDADFINQRLGLTLTIAEIKKILENVEFVVKTAGEKLEITAPFWRTDIEIPEDIVEEVGRLYGYDKLPLALPGRDLAPAARNVELDFKSQLRGIMSKSGGNEVLTYSFVNKKLLEQAGQDPKEAYHIRNAISPDLQYYRISLTPSLLEKVHSNNKLGYDSFVLFEIGKSHIMGLLDEEKLPAEPETLAAVIADPYASGAPYFAASNLAEQLFNELNITDVSYQPLTEAKLNRKTTWTNVFEASRTAVVWNNDKPLGLVGEPNQKLRNSLKLPKGTSMFELDIAALFDNSQEPIYKSLNRFPSTSQDICLKVEASLTFGEADTFVWDFLQKQADIKLYNYEVEALDIFQKPKDKSYKQITWRITLSHPERTLTTEEVNKLLDELAGQAKSKLKAERI